MIITTLPQNNHKGINYEHILIIINNSNLLSTRTFPKRQSKHIELNFRSFGHNTIDDLTTNHNLRYTYYANISDIIIHNIILNLNYNYHI